MAGNLLAGRQYNSQPFISAPTTDTSKLIFLESRGKQQLLPHSQTNQTPCQLLPAIPSQG